MTARIIDVTPDVYHAIPDFSSSTAKVLIAKSPLHARTANAKVPTATMDRGSIMHRLVLGRGAAFEVVEANDWRTKAAQEKRDAARAAGLVPVLADDFKDYSQAAEAIRIQLADRGVVLDGASEVAVQWNETTESGPLACKAMFDHVWLDRGVILDLKITEDAAPSAVERTSENFGYAIQAAAYTRALTALRPELAGRVKFLFAFCEPGEPYAINLCEPDGMFRELGERRWLRAASAWAACVASDNWPAYGTGVNYLNPPAWALAREGYSFDER